MSVRILWFLLINSWGVVGVFFVEGEGDEVLMGEGI